MRPYAVMVGSFVLAIAFTLLAGLSKRQPPARWPIWGALASCYGACVGIIWLLLHWIFQMSDSYSLVLAVPLALPYLWALAKTA